MELSIQNQRKMNAAPDNKTFHISFCTSAYNEESNIRLLYKQCCQAVEDLNDSHKPFKFSFSIVIVDNASTDQTAVVLQELCSIDNRVIGVSNAYNYGPEPSFMLSLELAPESEYYILLCADLQDPPHLLSDMIDHFSLDHQSICDAVLCIKKKSTGSSFLRLARRMYYSLLSFSNRDLTIPAGFHGFGCYKRSVILRILHIWQSSSLNLRSCICEASVCPHALLYSQPDRIHGKSSYSINSYINEATTAISAGKSLASRTSIRVGAFGVAMSIVLIALITINYLSGSSKYAGGVPSLAVIMVLSSTIQILMIALVARQIEELHRTKEKPKVMYKQL